MSLLEYKDPITTLLEIGGRVIDKIWPDPAQAASAKFELFKLQQSGELAMMAGQMQINQEEAKSPSLFVSGWRPFVGWVCASACAWNWMGLSMAKTLAELTGTHIGLAPASLTEMLPILGGMLGIGSLRTIEKIKGVA